MTMAENIIIFTTVLYGLALTDLLGSLHKVIRNRKKVRWHWLPLLVTWYVLLVLLMQWWTLIVKVDILAGVNIFLFIAKAHMLILVYLLVSAVLPDDISEDGLNLKDYYYGNQKYFWGLMALLNFVAQSLALVEHITGGHAIPIINFAILAIMPLLCVSLALTKRYWYHVLAVSTLFLLLCFDLMSRFATYRSNL